MRECGARKTDAGGVRPLVGEQVFGAGPALVLLADEVVGGYTDIIEEDLVYLVRAFQENDRPDRDAGRLHIDQQEGYALLRLAPGRGAHEAEDLVGVLAKRRPGLLAIDDVFVALAHGPRLQ